MKIIEATAHELFRFYTEDELVKFYSEFCLEIGRPEYMAITGEDFIFQECKLGSNFYIHDLNSIFKNLAIVRDVGGLEEAQRIIKQAGKWVHHKFHSAVRDAALCSHYAKQANLQNNEVTK